MRLLLLSAIAMGAHALDLCQMNEMKVKIREAIPNMLNVGGGMTSRGDAVGGALCPQIQGLPR